MTFTSVCVLAERIRTLLHLAESTRLVAAADELCVIDVERSDGCCRYTASCFSEFMAIRSGFLIRAPSCLFRGEYDTPIRCFFVVVVILLHRTLRIPNQHDVLLPVSPYIYGRVDLLLRWSLRLSAIPLSAMRRGRCFIVSGGWCPPPPPF